MPASTPSRSVRRAIGMVFQRPNPFPTMSIYDNVVAGLRLNGVKKKSELDGAVEHLAQLGHIPADVVAVRALERLQQLPEVIRGFFRDPALAYIGVH